MTYLHKLFKQKTSKTVKSVDARINTCVIRQH